MWGRVPARDAAAASAALDSLRRLRGPLWLRVRVISHTRGGHARAHPWGLRAAQIRIREERGERLSRYYLLQSACQADFRSESQPERATGWSVFCIVTLFLCFSLLLSPPFLPSLTLFLSPSSSLSLSLSHSFFQSLLSFPREFDHLANPVVARQARQTEAFRAIPDGAFIFPPLALPLDLLLLISLLSFLSDRSLSFFLLSCSDKIYRLPCRPRNFSASTKRAAVCRAICENYTILKAIPSNYNILWRLRVWKMVSSLAASWTRRIILFNTGLH